MKGQPSNLTFYNIDNLMGRHVCTFGTFAFGILGFGILGFGILGFGTFAFSTLCFGMLCFGTFAFGTLGFGTVTSHHKGHESAEEKKFEQFFEMNNFRNSGQT
jgi:hypothetical protein